jgi:hypothetical protein
MDWTWALHHKGLLAASALSLLAAAMVLSALIDSRSSRE